MVRHRVPANLFAGPGRFLEESQRSKLKSQGGLHYGSFSASTTSRAAPRPIQDRAGKGRVTTATPFRSHEGTGQGAFRAQPVDNNGGRGSSDLRRFRVAEIALDAHLSSDLTLKQGCVRGCIIAVATSPIASLGPAVPGGSINFARPKSRIFA